MKPLHEKKISEIMTLCCGAGEYCSFEGPLYEINDDCRSVHIKDLKEWAIAVVKEFERKNKLYEEWSKTYKDNGIQNKHNYEERKANIHFIKYFFEITEEDLK